MAIIHKLASSMGRRDEIPNLELAKEIACASDTAAIAELIQNLSSPKKQIQADCIKVLYEIGNLRPGMIAGYHADFVKLLGHKNNRLQWGAMTALNAIAPEKPGILFENLPKLMAVAEKGTVITKDHLMSILLKLCVVEKYSEDAFSLFAEQLAKSLPNQLPMYAEYAIPAINEKNRLRFITVLASRLADIEKDTKRKRVEKVIRRFSK